jgi:hypothetical protein
MKIVVVSDTHMPRRAKRLPERLADELKTADAVLHAGDWTDLSVFETLSAYAPTEGVAGNNDGADIVRRFGYRKVVSFGGCRIGLVHGHGPGRRSDTETRALEAFADQKLDAVVFGHSHIPMLKRAGGTLLFNPGSPTDKRRQPRYSFGIFRIEDGQLTAHHVFF